MGPEKKENTVVSNKKIQNTVGQHPKMDAHSDTSDVVLGAKIGHGTPFRRCVEDGLLDCKRVVQIGL